MLEKPDYAYAKLVDLLNLVELSCEEGKFLSGASIVKDTVKLLQKKQALANDLANELKTRNVPNTLTDFSKAMYEASEMYSVLIRPPIDLQLLRRLQEAHEVMDVVFQDWIQGMLILWTD